MCYQQFSAFHKHSDYSPCVGLLIKECTDYFPSYILAQKSLYDSTIAITKSA